MVNGGKRNGKDANVRLLCFVVIKPNFTKKLCSCFKSVVFFSFLVWCGFRFRFANYTFDVAKRLQRKDDVCDKNTKGEKDLE